MRSVFLDRSSQGIPEFLSDYLDVRDRNRTFDGVLAFNFAEADWLPAVTGSDMAL